MNGMNENYNIIDRFIIQNSTLFDYMGVAIAIFVLFAVFCLVYAVSLQTKKEKLKSRNKKSAFARAYLEQMRSSAVSNTPIKRNVTAELNGSNVTENIYNKNENQPNQVEGQNNKNNLFNSQNIIEICFEFDNKYDII